MEAQGSVTRLVEQLRSGDPWVRDLAAQLIWERYFRALLDLARRHLDGRTRTRQDEEDVAQSMYKSFCRRLERGDFQLANRDALWTLLVHITLCKAGNASNRHRRAKRDVRREKPLAGHYPELSDWDLEQMDASEPTPEEAAKLSEALEHRLDALTETGLREIAIWKLEGRTNHEIAELRACTERTVERKLERIRARWVGSE
jgi:RNA polymerase sigma factor (sigma-70 family)